MPEQGTFWKNLAIALTLASRFFTILFLGGGLGFLADYFWPAISPWGLLVGLLAGLGIATWQLIETTKRGS